MPFSLYLIIIIIMFRFISQKNYLRKDNSGIPPLPCFHIENSHWDCEHKITDFVTDYHTCTHVMYYRFLQLNSSPL